MMFKPRALLIIGAPGTGKTTLTKALMRYMHQRSPSVVNVTDVPLLPFTRYRIGVRTWKVLGVFSDEPTSAVYVQGTDRLSMGVQPHFAKFCSSSKGSLIIEGDRLANSKTLETLLDAGYTVIVYALTASDSVRASRYQERGSAQNPKFIAGRITKVRNLMAKAAELGVEQHWSVHETPGHLRSLVKTLAARLE